MKLIQEAAILAEKINIARFENRIPEAEDTVRLTEILDKLLPEEDAA
jgi:hypothetical protein|tara:strand:- start:316 stop:456 length:141 start_codon:yes stop_codon:yes gene_type:complete